MSSLVMQRRYRIYIAGCAVLLLITWYMLLTDRTSILPPVLFHKEETPLDFVWRASKEEETLDLTPTVRYSRRCIKPIFNHQAGRQDVGHISEPLVIDQVTLHLNQSPENFIEALSPCVSTELTVPFPYPTKQFPDFIFGMATLYSRMADSLTHITHWASDRGCKLIVILSDWDDQSKGDILRLQQKYRASNIQLSLIPPFNTTHSTSQSHFMVLTEMVAQSDAETKWFGLLDDDTFFPHLKPLSDALGQFDYTKDLYIGALSEDFGAVKTFGLQAFGGAGVFLSAALAKKLGSSEVAEACLRETPPDFGDIIIRDCAFHHSKAKLTSLPGLYQHDLVNDMRGFFESGVQPLSLHHWKTWYHEPVVEMAAVTKFCGDCFLQRWTFGGDTVFSNGYSISIYRNGVKSIDLDKMEKTFRPVFAEVDPHWDYTIGPLREKVSSDEIKTFSLKKTEVGDGSLRQLYIHSGNRTSDELDEVVELIWLTQNVE